MQSKKMLWTGRIISALVILFLLIDSVGKIKKKRALALSVPVVLTANT